jgi:hypothetical protein
MEHSKFVGDRTVLAVMIALHESQIPFLVPLGENTRFDLAIQLDSKLFRVQCKSGHLGDGAVRFETCSTYDHHPYAKASLLPATTSGARSVSPPTTRLRR